MYSEVHPKSNHGQREVKLLTSIINYVESGFFWGSKSSVSFPQISQDQNCNITLRVIKASTSGNGGNQQPPYT